LTGNAAAVATPVCAADVVDAIEALGTTHVVTVPDTHQRTVMAALDDSRTPMVRAATEDDVFAICAGLWMAGAIPVALIQQLGLFASVNALRAFTHDQGVPLAVLAGLYGRNVDADLSDGQSSAVRLCIPLLDALEIRWTMIERTDDAPAIAPALSAAFVESCTSVVLLGAPTT
jgi:sulfopyruvate decarboxylase TPP-binding subunit